MTDDEEKEVVEIKRKMLQIFYLGNTQLVIIDAERVLTNIYRIYVSMPPGTNTNIIETSSVSTREYCIGTQHIVNMILEDAPDNIDDDDDDDDVVDNEPSGNWDIGDFGHGSK